MPDTPDTSNSKETLNMTFETILALIVLVASFMYIYDFLVKRVLLDVLFAILIFSFSLVWLFSNVWRKK